MKKGLMGLTCLLVLLTFGASIGLAKVTKDGIDKKNKVIMLSGYDACTGKYGDYGLDDKRGQEIAVEEINAAAVNTFATLPTRNFVSLVIGTLFSISA